VSPDPDGDPNGEAGCTTVLVAASSAAIEVAEIPAGKVAPEPIGTSSGLRRLNKAPPNMVDGFDESCVSHLA
jgi:hypothetical protein